MLSSELEGGGGGCFYKNWYLIPLILKSDMWRLFFNLKMSVRDSHLWFKSQNMIAAKAFIARIFLILQVLQPRESV